ncbi:hypothetical protein SH668x_000126 [Planctomicrobium sp. SH668]|uniref:hypothetical protein n=1 Tax=Planctomicrobium sp. SH668 TaxID=3448126 RepID=UPI003F5C7287
MTNRPSNVVPFPVPKRHRGYEPSADEIAWAMAESVRLGEPINEQTARQLLIELYLYGFEPE